MNDVFQQHTHDTVTYSLVILCCCLGNLERESCFLFIYLFIYCSILLRVKQTDVQTVQKVKKKKKYTCINKPECFKYYVLLCWFWSVQGKTVEQRSSSSISICLYALLLLLFLLEATQLITLTTRSVRYQYVLINIIPLIKELRSISGS